MSIAQRRLAPDEGLPALLLSDYVPIELDQLNRRARLMDRSNNKYVLNTEQLHQLLEVARKDFDVLDIGGLRSFHYRSVYYDTRDFLTHEDHNKGRRRRIKIRHRHYVDHDLHYFEIKLKGLRGLTQKLRLPLDPKELTEQASCLQRLSPRLYRFLQYTLRQHYGITWQHELLPSIAVHYDRSTLVARRGETRITLDSNIHFRDDQRSVHLNQDRWVVEVKSNPGFTPIERWLFSINKRPLKQCSKYGMGINVLKLPHVNNRFSPILRRQFNHASPV